MKRTLDIPLAQATPTGADLLRAMGAPADRDPGARIERLVEEALEEFRAAAEPRGIFSAVATDAFAAIYEGAGDNEDVTPLAGIFPGAEALALFAVTVGAPLSDRVASLFNDGRLALGAALDAAASEGTELAAARLDEIFIEDLRGNRTADGASRVLRYSPGYCGWNLTGQRALFEALGPGEIGITLTDSCLMEPLKSISGVMVAGPAEIHVFTSDFPFCSECRTKDCRRRIGELTRT